ncbi:MAG: O-antigen ligase family protein [Candidatus Gracilibacteria bacterium]|nr:O-antigen ligase family protein [Candidatus Gracilibacteria bacterium]
MNTDILRFWKEFILIFLFLLAFFKTLTRFKWNFSKLYKNNYILGTTTVFALVSLAFIFLPFGQPKLSSFLGFKYDVFFLIALVIGLYLPVIKNNFEIILKTIFGISGLILAIFLPWYLFGDISAVTSIFGFSDKVSTYDVNSCISFAQNVNGQNRFQGTFSGPIRWSVFLTTFYLIYLGFILNKVNLKNKLSTEGFSLLNILLIIIPSIFVITSIFYSYSKTTILGLFFGISLFSYLVFKIKYNKKISTKFLLFSGTILSAGLVGLLIIKKDVFLHLGSVLNRFDNLKTSVEMFLWNPLGYGLGIAGPASWTGNSIESAGSWEVAVISTEYTHKFLPENWFVQILLEQGIIGFGLFIGVISIIGIKLFTIVKKKKDYLSIGIFTSFITLVFMANFTHAFEESATSYILFLIIGAYIAKNNLIKRKK